jgi:hypothetical protein
MLVSQLLLVTPALAQDACTDPAPGHSEYAQTHVAPLAQEGELGAGGHVPGHHQGYAGLCG